MTSTTPTEKIPEPLAQNRRATNNRRTDLLAAAILLLVVLVFLKDAVLMRGTFYAIDVACQNLPIQFHFSQMLRSGQLPLWTPQLFCGFPLHAEGQGGLFYPLNLLFQIRPIYVGLNLYVILHTFLAGLFIYWFARTMRISAWGALLAGIAYSLSALVSRHHGILNHFGSLVWIPVPLALLNLWVRNRRPIWVMLGGLVLGIEWLAGHPQFSWMAHLCLAWLLLFHLFAGSLPSIRHKLAAVGAVALMVAIGLGLAMVQLLPMRELAALSERSGGISYADIHQSGLPPDTSIDLLSPHYFGQLADGTALEDLDQVSVLYVGVLPLLLVPFACPRRQRAWALALLALAAIGAFLSFDQSSIASRLIAALPPANLFRYRSRYVILFVIALVLVSGKGLHALLADQTSPDAVPRTNRLAWARIAALALAGVVAAWVLYSLREGRLDELVQRHLAQDRSVPASKLHVILAARHADLIALAIFWTLGVLTLALNAARALPRRTFGALVLGQVAVASVFFGVEAPPLIDTAFYTDTPSTLQLVTEEDGPVRTYSLWWYPWNPYDGFLTFSSDNRDAYKYYSEMLATDLSLLYGVDNAQGFPHSLRLSRFNRLNDHLAATGDVGLLSLCNIRYVFAVRPFPKTDLTLIRDGKIKVYRNEKFLPRAFLVHAVIRADDQEDAFDKLIHPDRDLSAVAVVEDAHDMPALDPNNNAPTGTAQIVDYQATHVQIDVQTSRRALLVLTDTNYPDWHATIDGEPARIYQTDFLFRGVVVEPGTHRVTFDYRPASFRNGLTLSILTLAMLAAAIAVTAIRSLRARPNTPTVSEQHRPTNRRSPSEPNGP